MPPPAPPVPPPARCRAAEPSPPLRTPGTAGRRPPPAPGLRGCRSQAAARRTGSVGRITAAGSPPAVRAGSMRTLSVLIRSRGCRAFTSAGRDATAAGEVVEAADRHVVRCPPPGALQGGQEALHYQVRGREHRVQGGCRLAPRRGRSAGAVVDRTGESPGGATGADSLAKTFPNPVRRDAALRPCLRGSAGRVRRRAPAGRGPWRACAGRLPAGPRRVRAAAARAARGGLSRAPVREV